MKPFERKETVTSRDVSGLDRRIAAFVDDVAARKSMDRARETEFDEALSAIISPAFQGSSLHAIEPLSFNVELDERHLDRAKIVARLRVGLEPLVRNDLISLIKHVASNKTGVFGGGHFKAPTLPGSFSILLGRYDGERGISESYGYWSLYELHDWQADRVVAKIEEINGAYRLRALRLVGFDAGARPLFHVPLNDAPAETPAEEPRVPRIAAESVSIYPYRLFDQLSEGVRLNASTVDFGKYLNALRVVEAGDKLVPGVRKFDRLVKVEFLVPLDLIRHVSRLSLKVKHYR